MKNVRHPSPERAVAMTLSFHSDSARERISIELSPVEWERIQTVLKSLNAIPGAPTTTLGGWAKDALLRETNRRLSTGFPLGALETSIAECLALIRLLERMVINEDLPATAEGRKEDYVGAGINSITCTASIHLLAAFNAVFAYANGQAS